MLPKRLAGANRLQKTALRNAANQNAGTKNNLENHHKIRTFFHTYSETAQVRVNI